MLYTQPYPSKKLWYPDICLTVLAYNLGMEQLPVLLHEILDQINDGVYLVDPDRRITYWNHGAERITGYSRESVVGHFCMANILQHVNSAGETLCMGACPLAKTLKDGQIRETEVYLHHQAGHRLPVAVRVMPVIEDGRVIGAAEIFTEDISLASAMVKIEELQREAMLDPLTGIGNRRMAQIRLDRAQKEWEEHNIPLAALLMDVDHFKRVNDTYGHDYGDKVLRMVARSLSSGLRSYDFISRWGGEEFLALLVNVDEAGLKETAERLRMLVEHSHIFLDENDRDSNHVLKVTISIGGVLAVKGESLETLANRADQKLYISKANGRNRVTI